MVRRKVIFSTMSFIALLKRGPSALHPVVQCMHFSSKKRIPAWRDQQKRRLKKEDLAVGMIIRAPFHEEDVSEGGRSKENCRYISSWEFGHIHTKVRPFIVVALLNNHYLAVPLYTHNGTGIGKKDPNEYIYVHDKVRAEPGVSCPQHPNKKGWEALSAVIDRDDTNVPAYEPTSCAHFASLVPHRYGLPVSLEGKLEWSSMIRLLDLCSSKVDFLREMREIVLSNGRNLAFRSLDAI
ncbi:hypothetical protein BDR22DRAFT_41079 [Usnea florida]